MNNSIIASFLVGGLLLLAIFKVSNRIIVSSDQTTMNRVVKENVDDVGQVIDLDFRRMGMGILNQPITYASANKITFLSDTSNSGTISGTAETITWVYDTTQSVEGTKNPDDHPLYRIVNGVSHRVGMAITSFKLIYTMKNGTVTTSPATLSNIRRIDVEMVNESPEQVGNEYIKSNWQKLYIPANIQF